MGRIAPASIAQHQKGIRLWVGRSAPGSPPGFQTVAGKAAGVVAQTQVDVSPISFGIVQAMGKHDSGCQTGEIVISGFEGFGCIHPATSEEIADQFLFLGVDAEDRVGRSQIAFPQFRNSEELPVLVSMATLRAFLLRLPTTESMLLKELGNHRSTQPKAFGSEGRSNISQGKIGPANAFLHGVAGDEVVENLKKSRVQSGKQGQDVLAATPFFRDRPGGSVWG